MSKKVMPNITDNLQRIQQQIAEIAKNNACPEENITLLAVSKGHPASAIQQAYQAGQRQFGENYLQEALDKQQSLADLPDIHWHFIGPLQSNKTRKVAENFDWVHSIDRIKVAERLSRDRPCHLPPLNVCLQVNIDQEQSKAGVPLEEIEALALAVAELPNLRLRGLMAIPQNRSTLTEQRQPFATLSQKLTKLQSSSPQLATLDTLSMGMSNDMEAAIIEGSTINGTTLLRIGTAIFGPRATPTHTPNKHH